MPDLSVSAVVPVYNGAAFLRRAVASIQGQTVPVDAILIVDDCSTDGSLALAQELAREDARIVPIAMPVNGGPSAARNAALRAAGTSHVAFLDADDEWTPEHVRWLRDALVVHPECRVAFDIARWANLADATDDDATPRVVDPFPRLLSENFVVQSAVLVHRDTALGEGGYRTDMRYGEDYEFWCRLALAGAGFVEVRALGCRRTVHAGQASRHVARMIASAWDTRSMAVRARYPDPDDLPASWRDALCAAMDDDLAGAWNTRRRDALMAAIRSVGWMPESRSRVPRWESRVQIPAWYLWRAGAFLWDAIPVAVRRRLSPSRRVLPAR